ncbi:MAG TPA: cytochrome c oxidase subunit 3 [Candidatus Limnocylindria bacterium]|nr:cytochrome c oxidase subunit 3 [Candidatus Limnocylindria bacterium]
MTAAPRSRRGLHLVAPPPRTPAIPNEVLGTLIFVGAEAMVFAGLISAFVVLRAGMPAWPPIDQPRFPLGVTTLNTAVLLASGWTMHRARRGDTARWLGITLALGVAFLTIQGIEWARLVAHGLRIVGGVYGGLFATLIGTHAVHVAGGVVALWVAYRAAAPARGTLRTPVLTAVGVFWTFVVGVWPVLFVLVYLT